MSKRGLSNSLVGGGQGRPNLQPSEVHDMEVMAGLLFLMLCVVAVCCAIGMAF